MKTTIPGRYKVGTVLYFADATLSEQVFRGTRRTMTEAQVAVLTTVTVVAQNRATLAHQDVVAASWCASAGDGETSVVEFAS